MFSILDFRGLYFCAKRISTMYVRGYLQGSENGRVVTIDPQLFPIRPGMAQVFIRQRCRHIGFIDDFVTKRNN